jgi:lysozyme family protein
MSEAFTVALRRTEAFEGGWSNDPLDRGGETKFGVTQRTWDAWLRNPASFKYGSLPKNVADISRSMTIPLYKSLYWDACRCDELNDDDLASRIFDFAVNAGPGRAAKTLQQAYNKIKPEEWQELKEDGVLGSVTIQAINRCSGKYPAALLASFNYSRARYYESVIQNSPSQRRFIRGWFQRCL